MDKQAAKYLQELDKLRKKVEAYMGPRSDSYWAESQAKYASNLKAAAKKKAAGVRDSGKAGSAAPKKVSNVRDSMKTAPTKKTAKVRDSMKTAPTKKTAKAYDSIRSSSSKKTSSSSKGPR